MQIWKDLEEQLERLSLRRRWNQKLLARMKYLGQAVTIDNQGRVLIPMVCRVLRK